MKSPDLSLAWAERVGNSWGMDRTCETWGLTRWYLDQDPDLHPSVLGMAHLGAAITLFETCDPEIAEALLAGLEKIVGERLRA